MDSLIILRNAHLRATEHRIRTLELLLKANRPMSHVELLNAFGQCDRVTLYRILDAFVEANILHRILGSDGIWRFCAHTNLHHKCPGGHPHLMCESCGQMTCLVDIPIQHIDIDNIDPEFHISHKQFLILGTCQNCYAKKHT